jgi:hypothetical protein
MNRRRGLARASCSSSERSSCLMVSDVGSSPRLTIGCRRRSIASAPAAGRKCHDRKRSAQAEPVQADVFRLGVRQSADTLVCTLTDRSRGVHLGFLAPGKGRELIIHYRPLHICAPVAIQVPTGGRDRVILGRGVR